MSAIARKDGFKNPKHAKRRDLKITRLYDAEIKCLN